MKIISKIDNRIIIVYKRIYYERIEWKSEKIIIWRNGGINNMINYPNYNILEREFQKLLRNEKLKNILDENY